MYLQFFKFTFEGFDINHINTYKFVEAACIIGIFDLENHFTFLAGDPKLLRHSCSGVNTSQLLRPQHWSHPHSAPVTHPGDVSREQGSRHRKLSSTRHGPQQSRCSQSKEEDGETWQCSQHR